MTIAIEGETQLRFSNTLLTTMQEPVETHSSSVPYRFIDTGEHISDPPVESASPLTVEFYPSVEDFVHISEVNAKHYQLPSMGQSALQGFMALNAFGLPAVLFYFDNFVAGVFVAGLNFALAAVFLPATFRMDFRRFYRTYFPDLENEVVRVELHSEGIACQHGADSSFHAWKSIRSIEETKDAIFFYLNAGQGIAVRKSGFAYESQTNDFTSYARLKIDSSAPGRTKQIVDSSTDSNDRYR